MPVVQTATASCSLCFTPTAGFGTRVGDFCKVVTLKQLLDTTLNLASPANGRAARGVRDFVERSVRCRARRPATCSRHQARLHVIRPHRLAEQLRGSAGGRKRPVACFVVVDLPASVRAEEAENLTALDAEARMIHGREISDLRVGPSASMAGTSSEREVRGRISTSLCCARSSFGSRAMSASLKGFLARFLQDLRGCFRWRSPCRHSWRRAPIEALRLVHVSPGRHDHAHLRTPGAIESIGPKIVCAEGRTPWWAGHGSVGQDRGLARSTG